MKNELNYRGFIVRLEPRKTGQGLDNNVYKGEELIAICTSKKQATDTIDWYADMGLGLKGVYNG